MSAFYRSSQNFVPRLDSQGGQPARHSEACIERKIILRHALCGEAALECAPDAGSIERANTPHGLDRLILAAHDEAGQRRLPVPPEPNRSRTR